MRDDGRVPATGRHVVRVRGDGAVDAGRTDASDEQASDESEDSDRSIGTAAAPAALPRRRVAVVLLVAALVLVLDAVSKAWVVSDFADDRSKKVLGGLVYISPTRNSGAAFGLGAGYTIIFTAVAVVVVGTVARLSSRLRSLPWAIALGLILGGAMGNLIDRLVRAPGFLRGAVVDWISVFTPDGGAWPIFNLADSGIVCGGILTVLLALFGYDVAGGRPARAGERPS